MDQDIAISVKNVSKTFRIPHEKVSSIRGAFVGALKGKRTFEEFKALDDVSFEVKKGEFFGVIGRNGSGKSTLLKILAGIYEADKGTVRTNGLISPFLELGIGFNPELSGRDNIYLNATVLGMTKKQIDEKFDSIVEFSELGRFIDQKLKNYSSGMQVRLAFSVSIHANRDILLMDEVLAVGDSNFQAKCINEFELYKKKGKTVVLVSHDIQTVGEYCDRVMLLNGGKMEFIGDSKQAIYRYMDINMSEEERRMKVQIMEQEKVDLHSDAGSKRAIIQSCVFENSSHDQTFVLETGKKFYVKIIIKYLSSVSNPTFELMFKDNFGRDVYGAHSLYSRKPLRYGEVAKGTALECTISGEMLLAPGSYNVYVATADVKSHAKFEVLDARESIAKIQVFSDRVNWSPIDFDYEMAVKEFKERV
ncbi:MAG: ABC transporter ATP-binding protein [Candidatus Moranbacteria bacterium]|nr:ABC transporter ATP-binding protein [Candidatus Moranbacteria bacterium]